MTYTLYINSMSPYSIKTSALLGYAGVPSRVEYQNLVTRFTVLKRLTGKTMVPVLRRGEWAINDSTEIAHWAIRESDRRLLPDEKRLEPVCWLLEEFADEWISRWMVHSRWYNAEDADEVARRVGGEITGEVPAVGGPVGKLSAAAIKKGLSRGGVREANRRALEQSRDRTLQALENLFERREGFLFGGEPTVADFSLYGQLEQYRRDPTGGSRMQMYPAIGEWLDDIDRMRLPHPVVAGRGGGVEPSDLSVLLGEFFGAYWPVVLAAHRAEHSGGVEATESGDIAVELLDGTRFEFCPGRYLAGRLEFVVAQLDAICGATPSLIAEEALGIRSAVEKVVDQLAGYGAGRRLLRAHPHLSGLDSPGAR